MSGGVFAYFALVGGGSAFIAFGTWLLFMLARAQQSRTDAFFDEVVGEESSGAGKAGEQPNIGAQAGNKITHYIRRIVYGRGAK